MTLATISSTFVIEIEYDKALTAASLDPADFHPDTGETGIAIAQLSPNSVEVTFDLSIATAVSVTYSGSTPFILSPQTEPLS